MHPSSYTIYKKEKSNLAKFIVLDRGDKGDSGIGWRIGPPGYTQAGGPVRQTYAGVSFIPPVKNYEFAYCI